MIKKLMDQLCAYFWTVYFWFVLSLSALISYVIICLGWPWFQWLRGQGSHWAHKVACRWGQSVFALMPIWDIKIIGQENLPREGEPVVIVANHQSMADIWAIFCLNIPFRWLSKAEVFRIPVIGHGMKAAGYIPVQRGNKMSHKEALEQSALWLRSGVPMVFFPEGTRSKTGAVQPFKLGAFKLAHDEHVGVLPIALDGCYRLMKKGSFCPKPAVVYMEILPIQRQRDGESIDDFAHRVRELIVTSLRDLKDAQKNI